MDISLNDIKIQKVSKFKKPIRVKMSTTYHLKKDKKYINKNNNDNFLETFIINELLEELDE